VGLEWGSLSLVNTIEELLGKKLAASAKKTDITAVGIRHADYVTRSIHTKKLALTSPTSGGRSVSIVRWRAKAMELLLLLLLFYLYYYYYYYY
jgi:hypothetical protein